MSQSLYDLLNPGAAKTANRIHGVVVGIVTNNRDPDQMGRVRVRFPWLSDRNESWWARMAVPMAGPERGAFFLPEVDDEVLVAFEQGDVQHPYVVGALWNGKDKPVETNADGENNIRVIKSRSGHIVRLDDKKGAEKVEVIDKTGNNRVVIASADNSIKIECRGKLTIKAQSIEVTSDTSVQISAGSTMDAKANATMTIKGATVNIN